MIFPDFSSLFKIPRLFPDWKMPSHFSRFSSPSGNPVYPTPCKKHGTRDTLTPTERAWDQRYPTPGRNMGPGYPTPNLRKGHGPGTEPGCRVGPQMNKIEQVSSNHHPDSVGGRVSGGGYPTFPKMHVMYLPSHPQQNDRHLCKHYLPATSFAGSKDCRETLSVFYNLLSDSTNSRYTNNISEVTLQNHCRLFSSIVTGDLPPPYTPPLIVIVTVLISRYYYFIKPAKMLQFFVQVNFRCRAHCSQEVLKKVIFVKDFC